MGHSWRFSCAKNARLLNFIYLFVIFVLLLRDEKLFPFFACLVVFRDKLKTETQTKKRSD